MAAPLSKGLARSLPGLGDHTDSQQIPPRFGRLLVCVTLLLLLAGCVANTTPSWRSDAYKSYDAALAVKAFAAAPEETDSVRRTLELAERYYKAGMIEEADDLYRLVGLESRLLYRTLRAAGQRQGGGSGPDLDGSVRHDADAGHVDEVASLHDAVQADQHSLGQKGQAAPLLDSAAPQAPGPSHEALPGDKPCPTASTSRRPHAGTPFQARPAPAAASGRSTIYLTFDDGPSRLTLPIASYLKSQGIRATFFVLGCNVKGREDAVAALVAMGHRVGSHTFSHDLRKLKASFATDTSEIGRTASLIDRLGGDGRMVRLPYGASDRNLASHVAAEGAQIYEWDIDSYDSTKRGAHDRRFIERMVLGQLARTPRRHAIVLFHDGSGHDATLAALKDLIPLLKEQGYRFGLLSRNDQMARIPANGDATP